MKEESAQSFMETFQSSAGGAQEEFGESDPRLSQSDVINRLFAPDRFLPQPRNDKAIVIVTEGETERAVTHRQLENLIGFGAEQLSECGVNAGDKVVFYCDNSPELTALVLSCWSLNAMAALIDYRAERAAVLAMCKKLDAKLLVTAKRLYKDFALETRFFTEAGLEVLDVSAFAEYKDTAPKFPLDIQSIDLDRPAFTILTSGTTGNPKTSVHTLRSLVVNIIDLVEAANQRGRITALTPLPLSHVFGLTVFLIAQVLGAKTVLTQLEPVGFIKAVHRHKPEWIAALPQFYGAMLSAPQGFVNLSNAKLLLCGGAPLTVSLAEKFQKIFGKQLNNGYGSTECKLVAFNRDGGPTLCAGTPVGDIKIEIVNEQNEVMPEGKIGEVRIAGSMLMNGYLDNEKESRKVLRSGCYYTGDIGRFENGHLFVVGRKDDVVVVGGVIVRAGIVEEALRNNPQVKDVAVTAIEDKRLGQVVKASIVLMDDKIGEKLNATKREVRLDAQRELQRQFRAFCRENLTRFQIPMKWEFLGPHDDLPKTLAGKTDKKKLSGAKSP